MHTPKIPQFPLSFLNRGVKALPSLRGKLAAAALLVAVIGSDPAQASIYSQARIDAAVARGLHAFVNTPGNELQNAPMEAAMAINFMALVAHQDPATRSTGGT